MKQRLCVLGLTAGLLCFAVESGADGLYLGGSYDGYDRRDAQPQMRSYKGAMLFIH